MNNNINIYGFIILIIIGILNVSALEKSTGKKNQIVITNDAGRLTKAQIEKMQQEAKEFEEEDKKQLERIETKNKLQQLVSSINQTIGEAKIKEKLSAEELSTLTEATKKYQNWLDSNENASKDEIDTQMKELEQLWNPLVSKLYADGAANGGVPNGMNFDPNNFDPNNFDPSKFDPSKFSSSGNTTSNTSPRVDEVD